MQIKSLILYSQTGKERRLNFQLGKVNIITGKSKTGKTALISIIDYCLGKSDFLVPEGIIRDSVAWYAVLFQIGETELFVAKPAPTEGAGSQSNAYIKTGKNINIPKIESLSPNTNDDALKHQISDLIGITATENIPEAGQSRGRLRASIRQTTYYLFQDQNEIASKSFLFHKQQEQHIPQAIKDTIKYFLGVVQENSIILEQQLRDAKRRLKIVLTKLDEAESIIENSTFFCRQLFSEACELGIVNGNNQPRDVSEIREILNSTLNWEPNNYPPISNDRFPILQEEIKELNQKIKRKSEEIVAAETFIKTSEGYSDEANQQIARLSSIGLFKHETRDRAACPLCNSILDEPPPSSQAIQKSLENLQSSVHIVSGEQPKVREYIEHLKQERGELQRQKVEKNVEIDGIIAEQEVAEQIHNVNIRAARLIGRISFYLENVELTDETSKLRREVKEAQKTVDVLESKFAPEDLEEKLSSALSLIHKRMTEWARTLELEHSDWPYRLDLKKLTVVADSVDRSIPMKRMGSGENWLGCHLIALLSLHKHFIDKQRPVPRFLVLDQPSQVYFPSLSMYQALESITVEETNHANADLIAVKRMFNFLFDFCLEQKQNFQIIVLEHANLEDDLRFKEALVEAPWTDDLALITEEFLSD